MFKSKNNIKKFVTALLCATMLMFSFVFAACGDGRPIIGIIKFANHNSLNNCYEGLLIGLKEGGINIDDYNIVYHDSNKNESQSTAQAKDLVNKNSKIILAISTPSALAASTAVADFGIPVVYTAVSDPVAAGLDQMKNVTGSSDILNFDKQLELIRAFLPQAKKIGVFYTASEANSISQIRQLEKAAAKIENLEIVTFGVTNENELSLKTEEMLARTDIDAITNLTDNTVVDFLENTLIAIKESGKQIPVFGSEIEQVIKGCLASESIDYIDLGRKTGLMAAEILLGTKTASDMPFIKIQDTATVYNSEILEFFKLTLPTTYTNLVDVIVSK